MSALGRFVNVCVATRLALDGTFDAGAGVDVGATAGVDGVGCDHAVASVVVVDGGEDLDESFALRKWVKIGVAVLGVASSVAAVIEFATAGACAVAGLIAGLASVASNLYAYRREGMSRGEFLANSTLDLAPVRGVRALTGLGRHAAAFRTVARVAGRSFSGARHVRGVAAPTLRKAFRHNRDLAISKTWFHGASGLISATSWK